MQKTMKTAGKTATTVTNLDNLVEDVKIAEELVNETICEHANLDVWRDVEGFEGKYEVSLLGNLRFADKPDKRKVKCSKTGNYLTTLLYHKGNPKPIYAKIHMLVATAFVPNPEGYTCVRHKNGRLLDNRADNLEWVETIPKKRRKRKSKRTSKILYVSPILEVSNGDVLERDVLECDVAEGYVPDGESSEVEVSDAALLKSSETEGDLWKDVMGFEGRYKISKNGRVVSLNRKKPRCMKATVDSTKNGGHMLSYQLRGKDGKKHHKMVHMLVAEHFIPNPLGYKYVMHIDGNPQNNNVDNLRWTERSVRYRVIKSEDYKQLEGKHNLMTTQEVEQYYTDGTYINTFKSIAEAAEMTKLSYGSIKKVLNGEKTSIGGYVWKYSGNVYQTHLNRTIVEKHISKVSLPNWIHKVDKFIAFFDVAIYKVKNRVKSFFDKLLYTSVLTGETMPNS
jgi:hypothetical protein